MQNLDISKELDFFKMLDIPAEFGGDIDNDDFENIYIWCEDHRNFFLKKFAYLHGVSKLCLFFQDYDWVVKIPFNGQEYYECRDEKTLWLPFNFNCGSWDFCREELLNYEQAEEEGLECFFAETRYFCETNKNYPIYIQEKVIPMLEDTEIRTPSENSLSLARTKDFSCRCNEKWIASAIDYYGEELTKKFINFVMMEHPHVGDDLHKGNIGYRLDGSPCVLDYSGWFDYL
jgi:hypothetical protein